MKFKITCVFYTGDICRHEKTNSPGICKLVFECREAISDIRQGIPLTHCGWQGVIQIVCCPSSLTPQILTPTPQTFQQSNDESLRKSEISKILILIQVTKHF